MTQKSPSRHHRTTLSGCGFATKVCIDNRKKLVKQQYLLYMSSQYGELRPTSGWDRFVSLGHPCKFQLVSRLGSVTARYSSSGRQPNFAALNRGRHLCSAGRPSRWALAHILVLELNHCVYKMKYIALLCIFILYTQSSNSNIAFSTRKIQNITVFNYNTLPSSSQHLSTDDCMKDKRNDYQNCSMYDNCVQWYAYTHIYEDFTSDCQLHVLWIATTAKQCPHPWSLNTVLMNQHILLPSVLWHCCFDVRKCIQTASE